MKKTIQPLSHLSNFQCPTATACVSLVQLAEALKVATSFTPAVLSSMPAVFTAGVSGPCQDFQSHGTTKLQALEEDRAMCGDILASHKRDQGYRKTYLAFRDALESDAAAAAAWLNGAAQQEMLEKLRVLNEFKLRWEEQRWGLWSDA